MASWKMYYYLVWFFIGLNLRYDFIPQLTEYSSQVLYTIPELDLSITLFSLVTYFGLYLACTSISKKMLSSVEFASRSNPMTVFVSIVFILGIVTLADLIINLALGYNELLILDRLFDLINSPPDMNNVSSFTNMSFNESINRSV